MEKILFVDDEKSILELLKKVFIKKGYSVKTSISAAKAFELIDENDFDLILTDIRLPQKSGMDILKYVMKKKPEIPVIMMTAYGTIKQAVEAFKIGAVDYVVKPFDIEELKIVVAHGLEKRKLKEENILLKRELKDKFNIENIIGKSKIMQELFNLIKKISATDSTVLIYGESGTGKEIAARAIHINSHRKDKPFVTINCGALPENLLESELFGHAKGSFTGAIAEKKGMFEVAEKGTLFLDEVGEMSPSTQVKLLRALQERKIRKVGGVKEIDTDVRIIAATNQDIKQRIKEGRFREDLFYRLNILYFEMPPLRKRREDVPLLVSHFLEKYCKKMGRKMKRLVPEVISVLESYYWPGNVRELENVIERIVAIEERGTVTLGSLPKEIVSPQSSLEEDLVLQDGFSLNKKLDETSRSYLQKALKISEGSLKKTASLLGLNYRSLRYLIEKFGLKSERNRHGKTSEAEIDDRAH
jgi:DNA-binding NtrC family response regulator